LSCGMLPPRMNRRLLRSAVCAGLLPLLALGVLALPSRVFVCRSDGQVHSTCCCTLKGAPPRAACCPKRADSGETTAPGECDGEDSPAQESRAPVVGKGCCCDIRQIEALGVSGEPRLDPSVDSPVPRPVLRLSRPLPLPVISAEQATHPGGVRAPPSSRTSLIVFKQSFLI
jgi:hypothetical protein